MEHIPPTYIGCPHCGERMHRTRLAIHLRDTGTLDVRPVDACAVLFDLRNGHRQVVGA